MGFNKIRNKAKKVVLKNKAIFFTLLLFIIIEIWLIFFPYLGGLFTGLEKQVVFSRYWLFLILLLILGILSKLFVNVFNKQITDIKTLFEVLAITFAGIYFIYQLIGNLQVTALSIEVKSDRVPVMGTNFDHLSVSLLLNKTGHTSMDLYHIKGYIYDVETDTLKGYLFFNTNRYEANTFGNPADTVGSKQDSLNKYTLASDEATQFSAYKKVEKKPYKIEVVIIGRRIKFMHYVNPQFRASLISLPVTNTNK